MVLLHYVIIGSMRMQYIYTLPDHKTFCLFTLRGDRNVKFCFILGHHYNIGYVIWDSTHSTLVYATKEFFLLLVFRLHFFRFFLFYLCLVFSTNIFKKRRKKKKTKKMCVGCDKHI